MVRGTHSEGQGLLPEGYRGCVGRESWPEAGSRHPQPTGCHVDPSEGAEDQGGSQGQGRRDRAAWTLGQDQFVLQEKPRNRRAGVGDAGRGARLLLKVPTGKSSPGLPVESQAGKAPIHRRGSQEAP